MKVSLIGVAVSLALLGCATPTITSTPVVTTVPAGTIAPVITSISVTGTNGVISLTYATNQVATTVPTLVTNYVNVTNYTANGVLTQIAASAPAIGATVTTAVPVYGGMAGLAIGLIGLLCGGIGGGIAVYKNGVANQHMSTLQAVISGVENALPSVQQALSTTVASGVIPPGQVANALAQANAALGAVKGSITSATNATGTAQNLTTVAATVGAGPLA